MKEYYSSLKVIDRNSYLVKRILAGDIAPIRKYGLEIVVAKDDLLSKERNTYFNLLVFNIEEPDQEGES